MKILLINFYLWQLTISFVDLKDVVSDEKHDLGHDRREDTVDFDSHRTNRRFEIDDDKEWHEAHLKKRAGRGRCKAETLQDRIARYKQSIREDPSLLEFVSGDAIPVDVKDIQDPCLSNTEGQRRNEGNDSAEASNKNVTNVEESKANVTTSIDDILFRPATPASAKVLGEGINEDVEAEKIRRSEYQFSSIEYYEETSSFDPAICPDEVEEITLQVDDLKKIDIECELEIEWRSLE